MRPDEHKKKKNAAYKKKHGITKEAGDKKEGKASHERVQVIEKSTQKAQTKKSGSASAQLPSITGKSRDGAAAFSTRARTGKSSSTKSSSGTEDEDQSKKKPSRNFRRREIVSNWQKYEIPPETEDKVLSRGENYEKLLNMAGEAISHFRFRDEKNWDDPGDAMSENDNDKYSQLLSVNSAELAQSLACLPTFQLLGVSENIFPTEQLSAMKDTASTNRSAYISKHELKETAKHLTGCNTSVSIGAQSYSNRHSTPHSDQRLNVTCQSSSTDTSEQRVVDKSKSLARLDASESPKTDLNARTRASNCVNNSGESSSVSASTDRCTQGDSTSLKPCEKLNLQDSELDALLGPDGPANGVREDGSQRPSQKQLTSSNPVTGGGFKSSTVELGPAPKTADTNTADLEAWLDSVLDD